MSDSNLTLALLTCLLSPHLGEHAIVSHSDEPIGTGQMSESRRLHLAYSGPAGLPSTMIAKFESASESSRQASQLTRTNEIETGFYSLLQLDVLRAPITRKQMNSSCCWKISHRVIKVTS
jgi:hypothetical protein